MSERPASHDQLAMWPRTPRYHTLHTSCHTHEQTVSVTSLTPSHPCHKRTHIYQNHNQIHSLVYAHSLKRRSHTRRTPNGHAHPDQVVDPTPLHTYTSTTLTIPPNHVPIPPSHKKANAFVHALNGNGPPVTRSQPIPPNPRSPDAPSLIPLDPLKPRGPPPLPQSPGSSIAHLRNQDRTPPLVRPQPPAKTPITVHPITTTPNPHTRTHIHPKHIASSIDNTPTPTTSPSLVRPNINRATTKKTTHRRNHPYSRFTHNLNFNSPHASTCHMCPDTTVTIPPHPDMTPPPFLVSNPIHDSPPFNLDSHSDFPPIHPSSSTSSIPQPTLPPATITSSHAHLPASLRLTRMRVLCIYIHLYIINIKHSHYCPRGQRHSAKS